MMSVNRKQNFIRYATIMLILAAILLFLIVFSVCAGKYPVSPAESLSILFREIFKLDQAAEPMTVNVVIGLRLPRIIASILVGAALSVSGACYQSIFRNPLVSPDFLGVSGGACIGAAAAILFGLGSGMVSLFAFFGGLAAVLITASIPVAIKNESNIMLVLSGIIVGSLMSSVLGFIKYVADPDTQLASITYWTMGNFSYVSMSDIAVLAGVIIIPSAVLVLMSWWLDVLSLGIDEAKTLGANVKLIRLIAVVSSTLITSASVCLAGTIGWVGLIIPHLSRMLVGSGNGKLLPASCLVGGIFMLFVDTLTRTIGVTEMPVSIMTGIIGAPFFCWLLFKRKDRIK